MVRLNTGPVHGQQITPEVLKPLHELWTNDNFQKNFVDSVRADLNNFKECVWDFNFENLSAGDRKIWTEILGLPIPTGALEWQQCMTAIRAVVSYSEWKFSQVEKRAVQFHKLTREE